MSIYYRVILGQGSAYAQECFAGGFIGVDYGIDEDLKAKLPEEWREFNLKYIPVYLAKNPGKTKIGAGLACGALWTVSKGIKERDIVLSPDGTGSYRAAEVEGDYYYAAGQALPHRRKVRWLDVVISKTGMSEGLQGSVGSIAAVANISRHGEEIERILKDARAPQVYVTDPTVENAFEFALEKHLEGFLVANWDRTPLGGEFSVFAENGELVGQQFPTDAGLIDILAVSKDKKRLLVVELKRGRASDVVVGQVLRYMGVIKEQFAEEQQSVEGVIIALEDDQKLRWALLAVPSVSFYRYQVSFRLVKA